MTPTISIITCAYNRPDMLREAIASLQAQTRSDYEHLIVDAGSTGLAVWKVIAEAARQDVRIRAFCHEVNVDQPARYWNEMIDQARGRYVGFLDDDNAKFPTWIEKLSAVLDSRPEVDAVTCGFVARFSDGHSEENHLNLRTAEIILERNSVDTGCFLIRREALDRIGYFPEDIRTNEDWAMAKRMHTILRVVHLPDCLATWREHPGQRMARCKELGNDADKARIRGRDWKPNVGVRVVLGRDVSDELALAVSSIPWVCDGDDIVIALHPDMSKVDEIKTYIRTGRSVVLILNGDRRMDGIDCVNAAFSEHSWIAAGRDFAIAGDRTIAWRGGKDVDWTARMARIINCVRSPRFGAVIP